MSAHDHDHDGPCTHITQNLGLTQHYIAIAMNASCVARRLLDGNSTVRTRRELAHQLDMIVHGAGLAAEGAEALKQMLPPEPPEKPKRAKRAKATKPEVMQ